MSNLREAIINLSKDKALRLNKEQQDRFVESMMRKLEAEFGPFEEK